MKQIIDVVLEEEKKEQLEEWKKVAFIGFQLSGKEGMTFNEYLNAFNITESSFGLEEPENNRGNTTTSKEKAMEIAQRVIRQLNK